jgi:hypothetical protein
VRRAQPDDHARHARHRPDPLIRAARRETQSAIYSCTKAYFGHLPYAHVRMVCAATTTHIRSRLISDKTNGCFSGSTYYDVMTTHVVWAAKEPKSKSEKRGRIVQ